MINQTDQNLKQQVVYLRKTLKIILEWNSHAVELAYDYGSNGVRDYYRNIAKRALQDTEPLNNKTGIADD